MIPFFESLAFMFLKLMYIYIKKEVRLELFHYIFLKTRVGLFRMCTSYMCNNKINIERKIIWFPMRTIKGELNTLW